MRLTERCLPGDPPTPDEIEAATELTQKILADAFAAVPVAQARTFIGVAGTVTTLSAVHMDLPEYDSEQLHLSRMPLSAIRKTTADLLAMTREQRAALGPMHPGRVDVIGAGALVLRVLVDQVGVAEIVVSEHDILDGIARSIG